MTIVHYARELSEIAIPFFAYLGDRLGLNGTVELIPLLPSLVSAQPA